MRELINVQQMLPALGFSEAPPLLGWVFSAAWAKAHQATLQGFLAASHEAKQLLASSDAEWQRLRPLTGAENDTVLVALRDAYRQGIVTDTGKDPEAAAAAMLRILAEFGALDPAGQSLAPVPGTFWTAASE